jgi:archaetidylinositol phosphate synthase
MLTEYKPRLNNIISAVAKPFIRFDPNILTFLGLVPPIFFLIFLINKSYFFALLMFGGLILDTIDGAVARMTNRVTSFGGFLDSSLDRIADFLFITAFGFAGIVRFEIVCIVLLLSFLISYLRSRAELAAKGNISLAVGIIERGERMLFLVFALFAIWIFPDTMVLTQFNAAETVFVVLGFLSLVTVIQRIKAAYERLK